MWTVHTSEAGSFPFGQIGRLEWKILLPIGALIGVMALGVWAIFKVKKWREQAALEVGPTRQEQRDHYRKMVDEGLLDPEEFARIMAQLDVNSSAIKPDETDTPPGGQPPDTSIREM